MNIKRLIAGCALITMTSLALLAGAQDHPWSACKDATNQDDCMQVQMDKQMEKHRQAQADRETKLHDALKLTPAQEPAWKALTDHFHQQMTAMQADRQSMPTRAAMEKMSAPERMENHLMMMQKHLAMMQTELSALKSLYAVLTPEQQATMNAAMNKMAQQSQRWQRWQHWQHGHHGSDLDT